MLFYWNRRTQKLKKVHRSIDIDTRFFLSFSFLLFLSFFLILFVFFSMFCFNYNAGRWRGWKGAEEVGGGREFQPTLITRFLISFLIEMWIFLLLKIFQLSLIHFLKIKFIFLIFFSPRIFTIFCFSLNFQLVWFLFQYFFVCLFRSFLGSERAGDVELPECFNN